MSVRPSVCIAIFSAKEQAGLSLNVDPVDSSVPGSKHRAAPWPCRTEPVLVELFDHKQLRNRLL
jgi:hypothetical protein